MEDSEIITAIADVRSDILAAVHSVDQKAEKALILLGQQNGRIAANTAAITVHRDQINKAHVRSTVNKNKVDMFTKVGFVVGAGIFGLILKALWDLVKS